MQETPREFTNSTSTPPGSSGSNQPSRGHDGRFIEVGGWIKSLMSLTDSRDAGIPVGAKGQVRSINSRGHGKDPTITVRFTSNNGRTTDAALQPKQIEQAAAPKGKLGLPQKGDPDIVAPQKGNIGKKKRSMFSKIADKATAIGGDYQQNRDEERREIKEMHEYPVNRVIKEPKQPKIPKGPPKEPRKLKKLAKKDPAAYAAYMAEVSAWRIRDESYKGAVQTYQMRMREFQEYNSPQARERRFQDALYAEQNRLATEYKKQGRHDPPGKDEIYEKWTGKKPPTGSEAQSTADQILDGAGGAPPAPSLNQPPPPSPNQPPSHLNRPSSTSGPRPTAPGRAASRPPSASSSPPDGSKSSQLRELFDLHQMGALTDAEFTALKQEIVREPEAQKGTDEAQ